MKCLLLAILAITSTTAFSASKVFEIQNEELIKNNALTVISTRVLEKFKPEAGSLSLLRHSRSGVATFLFTSNDGKFRGEAHCVFSGLLLYKETVSNKDETCFLINMYENDKSGINNIGKQVGIY